MATVRIDDWGQRLLAVSRQTLTQQERQHVLSVAKVIAVAEVKRNIEQGRSPTGASWPPLRFNRIRGGTRPLRDQGLLLASITGRTDDRGVYVGSPLDYAAIHNYGGTIRPKKAKYLAIPVTRAAQLADSPRNFPQLSFRPVRRQGGKVRGSLISEDGETQYLLVTHVDVPQRRYLGLTRESAKKVTDAASAEIAKALQGKLA